MAFALLFVVFATMSNDVETAKQLPQKKPASFSKVAQPSRKCSQQPLYGWCSGRHPAPKPAQSGMEGLCKVCYKEKHPLKYANIVAGRKRRCVICLRFGEMVQRDLCKKSQSM